MAFMDKVQALLQKVKPQQQAEAGMRSNLSTGGFSGYHPKVERKAAESSQFSGKQPVRGFAHMVPEGMNADGLNNMQDVGGQTGNIPPQQMQQGHPMNGTSQQRPMAQGMGYTPQQMGYGAQQAPQGTGYQHMQQPMQGTGYQQQTPPPQMNQGAWQGAPGTQPQVQQNQQPAADNVAYFPGAYVDPQGGAYRMILRVAQITGISSCYRLIEFMQNNEAMIVNAEQITDVMEADRCMDLLFGAAYAMKQRFIRVSGKQIYLITPPQVQVQSFDSINRMGMEDLERRWPGSMEAGFQQRGMQGRQDDFAGGFGHRAPMGNPNAGAYTDYGGFGMRG